MKKGIAIIRENIKKLKTQIKLDYQHVKDEPKEVKCQSLSGKWAFKRIKDNTKAIESLELIRQTIVNQRNKIN